MPGHSFLKTVIVIILIFVGLGLILFGFRVYVQYRTSTTTPTTTNTNSKLPYIAPTVNDDPYLGPTTAPVTIIAFEDFQCPFCQQAEAAIMTVLKQYPTQVKFVYRDFPLYTIHPYAMPAAQAGECADEQSKFWPWHDLAFTNQKDIATPSIFSTWAASAGLNVSQFNSCVAAERYKAEVQKDQDDGFLAGVNVTPTWFVNGTKIEGVLTAQQWTDLIDSILAK